MEPLKNIYFIPEIYIQSRRYNPEIPQEQLRKALEQLPRQLRIVKVKVGSTSPLGDIEIPKLNTSLIQFQFEGSPKAVIAWWKYLENLEGN